MVSDVLRSQSLCTCCVMNAEGREERVSLGTNMELLSMELVCTWASLLDQNTHSERNVGFSGPLRDWDIFFVLWHLLKALLHPLKLVLFQSELEGGRV